MTGVERILNAYSTVREEVPLTGPGAPPTSLRVLVDAAMLSLSPSKDARALRRQYVFRREDADLARDGASAALRSGRGRTTSSSSFRTRPAPRRRA